jgi:hypothetical protein
MRVFVYWNLHRRIWSIRALEGENRGRVIAHAPEVAIVDAALRVSEAGRQRVIREKRKNVHAGVLGTLADIPADRPTIGVRYNPYETSTFVRRDTGAPVLRAGLVLLDSAGKANIRE